MAKEKKSSNYLKKGFTFNHVFLLVASGLAIATLVLMLTSVFNEPYERFYFDGRPIVYIFFILIFVFIAFLILLVVVRVASKDQMPTYDEFKRAENKLLYLQRKSRFPELSGVDVACDKYTKIEESNTDLTLSSFCDEFRDYMANKLRLYYSVEDIRKFVANLATSKMMILQGMSGTGKTSIAVAFGKFINNSSTVVPVQPMWKEKSDLLGYYNEFTGKFNETTILNKLYEANYSNKIFIIVMDEMNIARVEYYFSEFLSLLELPATSERKIAIASNGAKDDPKLMSHGRIVLPDNVWFLGTANNDDSTFAISDKVYDRAMVMNLNNRAARFKVEKETGSVAFSADRFNQLIEEARRNYSLSSEGLRKIKELDEYLISTFQITFGNRIMMQIKKFVPVYIACGGNEDEALDDLIAKKILRKLEAQNPIYVKNKSIELITKFDEIFGQDVLKSCIEYVKTLANNI